MNFGRESKPEGGAVPPPPPPPDQPVRRLDPAEQLLQYFTCGHLPPRLQLVSRPFRDLATTIFAIVPAGPERTVCMRKLLEAKDCAVRAAVSTD